MSGTRLPLLGARPAAPRSSPAAPAERLAAPRRLVTIAAAEADAAATPVLLDFVQGLLRALAEHGSPPSVLVVAGEWRADQLRSLRDGAAADVIELPPAELGVHALQALERLPEHAVALGVGAAFAQQLRPTLAVRIGPARKLDGQADLELPHDARLVSSAIAARLTAR